MTPYQEDARRPVHENPAEAATTAWRASNFLRARAVRLTVPKPAGVGALLQETTSLVPARSATMGISAGLP